MAQLQSTSITGSLTVSGSLIALNGLTGTATTASYVDYSNIANKPTLISGSSQVAIDSTTGTLSVGKGGTGQTSYTNGQLLIGNTTGNTLTKGTLTAGTGISVTNGAGSITIAATNNGTVTSVATGTGLTGGTITSTGTISHADTSTQASVNNSGRTFIQDITLDDFGHVTGITSATDADTYVGTVTSVATGTGLTGGTITSTGTISLSHLGIQNLTDPNADRILFWDDSAGATAWLTLGTNLSISGTTINATDTNTTYSAGAGITLTGTTFSHTDTSSQTSVNNSGRTFIQDITLDDYGHVTAITSATDADTYVGTVTSVAVSGSNGLTGSGTVTTSGTINLQHADTSAQASVNNSGRTFIQDITLDTYGHVTAITSATDADTYVGTVTSVAVSAGNGLTGGGTVTTSGTVTLNVGAGTGIDVAADAISVDVSDFMTNGADNRVVTATGTDAMNAEANLTFDGSTLDITGNVEIYKSGSTVLDIQGSTGQLFSVTDSLTGTLMSVNDISGLPILEVTSDDGVTMGTFGSPAITVSGSSAQVTGSLSGNAATATNLSTTRSDWSTNGTISAVVGQLSWKHYGNNHTIFDASNGTSPQGTSVNTTNATVAWTSTYPTLMGWNGSTTYGVRVDSARVADTAAAWTTARTITLGGDLTGNVSINGSANVTLTATIAANSVALGTDTTGNYVGTITAGTGIDTTGATTGEGIAHTISVDVSDFMTNGADNRVVTATGTDAMNAEANLTFDGTDLTAPRLKVGAGHTLSGTCATIAGGCTNIASGNYSTVVGGRQNTASAYGAFIGGGCANSANQNYTTIGGGVSNTASSLGATTSGGQNNTASGFRSTVSGGYSNTASGNCSGILGGTLNHTCGYANSFIVGSSICATQACTLFTNHILPGACATFDLGSASYRWNNIYTMDLSLQNDHGDWTIVEGEDDLFLYNNKKGKVYKFNLTEVDPSIAPPKRS
jgi:hypothetical protein